MATEKESGSASAAPSVAASYDAYAAPPTTDSLPLIVRMPNGERHQVDVAPTASVKDLKTSIANQSSSWGLPGNEQDQAWDLDFGGATLNDNQTLSHYNIPDVYDHANGLLKTISDSGYGDPDKKVEALDKACAVVAGISRGEKDMERLINAVFDEVNDPTPESPSTQPSLRALKRSRRSRIPPLNFGSLPPPGHLSLSSKGVDKAANPSAPPTPSQLIRKLSGVRPDLYDPSAVERTTASLGQPGSTSARVGLLRPSSTGDSGQQPGSGELRRGNTWFTDYMSSLGNSVLNRSKRGYNCGGSSEGEGKDNDVDGDSEGEGEDVSAGKSQSTTQDSRSEKPSNNVKQETSALNDSESKYNTAKGAHDAKTHESKELERAEHMDSQHTAASNGQVESTTAPSGAPSATMDKNSNKPSVPSVGNPQQQVIGLGPDAGPTEDIKLPKKRGRKRKNPHLTEEERKAQRQAQNRESAKQSRIRRKNMTIEYERRVNTLEGENENLRDTVAALTDRLEMLQNLLTISVQKRPMSHLNPPTQDGIAGLAQLGSQTLNVQPPLTGQGALSAPGALNAHAQLTSQRHYHNPSQAPGHQQMTPASQGLPGASGIPESTASQSNPLANLGYKNF